MIGGPEYLNTTAPFFFGGLALAAIGVFSVEIKVPEFELRFSR